MSQRPVPVSGEVLQNVVYLVSGGQGMTSFLSLYILFCKKKKKWNILVVYTGHLCNCNFFLPALTQIFNHIYPLGFPENNGRRGEGNSSSRRTRGRWRPYLLGTHPLPVRGNPRHIVTEQQAPVCFLYQYPSLH